MRLIEQFIRELDVNLRKGAGRVGSLFPEDEQTTWKIDGRQRDYFNNVFWALALYRRGGLLACGHGADCATRPREGVEAQSETVWRQANKYDVPRIAFINKLDREGANFEAVADEIGKRLQDARPIALQIPVGLGPAHTDNPFRGMIDLITMKMLTFPDAPDGKTIREEEIPDSLQDEAATWREAMLETLYNFSEAHAPLAELFGYSNAMRSLSQGRAGVSVEPFQYAPAPPDVADGFAF